MSFPFQTFSFVNIHIPIFMIFIFQIRKIVLHLPIKLLTKVTTMQSLHSVSKISENISSIGSSIKTQKADVVTIKRIFMLQCHKSIKISISNYLFMDLDSITQG